MEQPHHKRKKNQHKTTHQMNETRNKWVNDAEIKKK